MRFARMLSAGAAAGSLTLLLGCSAREADVADDVAADASDEASESSESGGPSSGGSGLEASAGETQSEDTTAGETANFVTETETDSEGVESCSVIQQDCPEGDKCVWYVPPQGYQRRDAARCIPVTGDIAPFEPCTLPNGIGPAISDDCGPESFCLEVYGTADHGFCAPFATDHPDFEQFCAAWPGTQYATENGSTFPDACLHYECNPLDPTTCPADMRCDFYPAFLYGTNMCWKIPAELDLPLGAPCDFGSCGPGELCAAAEWLPACEGERCCTSWCDLADPDCPNDGSTCVAFPVWGAFEDPDYANLGACVLPGSFE